MQEIQHVLDVLKQSVTALKNEDIIALKNLSNQTIHTSSITQDPDNIIVAVVIYALSKITERTKYREYKDWTRFHKSYIKHLEKSTLALQEKNLKKFRKEMQGIREEIHTLSGNLKIYIEDVFRKAAINRASRIYEHGISLKKTAKILGISTWELAEYTGETGISEVNLSLTLNEKQRIKYALDVFS